MLDDDIDPDAEDFVYEEMAWFHENCREHALEWDGAVEVQRTKQAVSAGHELAALRWGSGSPEIVLLHGGAQNAHTWDTVLLALRPVPALAIDLPGHGHSGWRDDSAYDPHTSATAVIEAMEAELDGPVVLVGMSLGGLTANAVAARRPDLVDRLVVVDVTPGVDSVKAKAVHDFVAGPQYFSSFEEIFERTVEYNPTRSASSLRRGILHNAHRLPDGSWQWNYDRRIPAGRTSVDFGDLWGDVSATTVPYLLVRGADSPVVGDEDLVELLARRPDARVEIVAEAGHSVQGDQPLVLAGHIAEELRAR